MLKYYTKETPGSIKYKDDFLFNCIDESNEFNYLIIFKIAFLWGCTFHVEKHCFVTIGVLRIWHVCHVECRKSKIVLVRSTSSSPNHPQRRS